MLVSPIFCRIFFVSVQNVFNTFPFIHLADAFQGDLELMAQVINHIEKKHLED